MSILLPTKQHLFQTLVTELRRNPYPIYRVLRHTFPLMHVPGQRLWLTSTYDDTKRVLSDYANFSSDFVGTLHPEVPREARSASLITSDPPEHTKLRGLVTRAFTPRAVARLEPRIAQLTHELLDRLTPTGYIDLIQDVAFPLPVIVIAEMLGIPSEDRAQFKRWSDAIVVSADRAVFTPNAMGRPEGVAQAASGGMPPWLMGDMGVYFREIIARRRADPGDDLISGLIAAEVEGEHLSDRDVLSFCWLLLVAGNVTTTNLIGNAIVTLLDYPDQLACLQANPELMPRTIEEVLRYRSPVQLMFRIVKQDIEMSGKHLRRGERVLALIGSGNRDERQFAHGEIFDIARDPNPHIGFGHGIHYCLGAPLARLEARIALPIILERLPQMQRLGPRRLEPIEGVIVNGVKNLPLRFRPTPAVAAAPSDRPLAA